MTPDKIRAVVEAARAWHRVTGDDRREYALQDLDAAVRALESEIESSEPEKEAK